MTKSLIPSLARRKLLQLGAGAAAVPFVSIKTLGQAYPTRTVTLMVFTPAGAIPDIVARLIGDVLSQRLGHPVIIENRPGAGGTLAMQAVARAPADGHTLLLLASVHTVAASLYPSVPVRITRDIAPVATLNRDAFVLLVKSVVPGQITYRFHRIRKGQSGQSRFCIEWHR